MIWILLWFNVGALVMNYLSHYHPEFPFLAKIDKELFTGFILACLAFPLVIAKFYLYYRK